MNFKLESVKLIWRDLGIAKSNRMTPVARVLARFMLVFACSAFTLAQASASAELRKIDIANRKRNIKIIYTEPLKSKAEPGQVVFKGLPYTVLSDAQIIQFEREKLHGDAANSYLSAKARYLLSAKKIGNGFFSDAEDDRRKADEAGTNYARVDELATEQEQAEEAAAAKKKKPKAKRNIASITVPAGFAKLGDESSELEN